jgi:transposase
MAHNPLSKRVASSRAYCLSISTEVLSDFASVGEHQPRDQRRRLLLHRRDSVRVGIERHGDRRVAVVPYLRFVEQWLSEDAEARRKQRHTARRIYDRLVEEHGYPGSEVTVRRAVARLRPRLATLFVPR